VSALYHMIPNYSHQDRL